MKKLLLMVVAGVAMPAMAQTSQVIEYDGGTALLTKHLERQIGPGTRYYRYRLTETAHPQNINIVTVDMTNPYVRIETTTPYERSAGTERLVDAAKRQDAKNHHAYAGQNGNFWIVSTQPQWDAYGASTHGVSLRNGMLSIDATSIPHWWKDFGPSKQGIVSVSTDNELFIDVCRAIQTFTTEKLGTMDWISCNKGFKLNQVGLYTKFYGPDRKFLPLRADTENEIAWNDIHYEVVEGDECVEVLLDIEEGETWMSGKDIRFKVAEVIKSNGRGTLGKHDAALVSRNMDLAKLAVGDAVSINYSFVFNRDGKEVTPLLENAVGGNMMILKDGQITEQNYWDSYNTMVYSRSAYGTSRDNKTLYMVVIDKSGCEWGVSDGCTTEQMLQIVKPLGVWNMINVDAGGSAQLMVTDRIINTTTEGVPRQVGNGWLVYNTSDDEDKEIAQLEFEAVTMRAPTGAYYKPTVIAYNKYGTPLDWDYQDFTVSGDEIAGKGEGNRLLAGGKPGMGVITATAPNGVKVSKEIEIVAATPVLRGTRFVIDSTHPYTIETQCEVDGNVSFFDPALITWTVDNPEIATVDDKATLHAVSNGVANVTGVMGDVTLSAQVLVQSASDFTMPVDPEGWTGWKASVTTGLSKASLAADGTVGYTYTAPRGTPAITLTKKLEVFGLPEKFSIDFTSDVPVAGMEFALRAQGDTRSSVKKDFETPLAAGETHTVDVRTDEIGDVNDRLIFPIAVANLKFKIPVNADYKGTHTIKVTGFKAHYSSVASVSDIIAETPAALAVTPAAVYPVETFSVTADGLKAVTVYSISGQAVMSAGADGNGVSLSAPAAPGLYIVRGVTDKGAAVSRRLLVK